MIAIEENQENRDSGREQEQPLLCEHIGFQHTTPVELANLLLLILISTVERGEIDVGRSVIDVDVTVIGSEYARNEKGVSEAIKSTE